MFFLHVCYIYDEHLNSCKYFSWYNKGDRNFTTRKFPPHAKYAIDANLFWLESPILTRAKRATNRNNVGGEVSPQGWKTLGGETSGGEKTGGEHRGGNFREGKA